MRLDPFRIDILTVSLDSQFVLTVVGLVVAGVLFGRAARERGLGLDAGHWWDLVFDAIVGGRVLWVLTHPEYFIRQPLQIVAFDGGLHAVGMVLGAAYWLWRLQQSGGMGAAFWRPATDLAALGILTTYLFERARFSQHAMGPQDRERAWHALVAVKEALDGVEGHAVRT